MRLKKAVMEVESSGKWKANTVNFVLEGNIYLRLATPSGTTIWYKAIAGDKFHHVLDDRKLNEAWGKYELQ
jgi:hypothetical protein|tara:strand:- start:186 stop:398 length:213 start_codon:yes stop_codon:yes gene_type:complete